MNEIEIDTPTTEWNDDDDNIVQYLNKYPLDGHSQWIEKVEKILKDRCKINGTKISKLPLNRETDMSILHTAMELKNGELMIEMMCMIADHTIGLNILHDKKADINAKDNYGYTPIMTNVRMNANNYYKTLLKLPKDGLIPCDLEAVNEEGDNVLHICADNNDNGKKITVICNELKIRDETKGTKILDKLLSMKNNEGKTVYDVALEKQKRQKTLSADELELLKPSSHFSISSLQSTSSPPSPSSTSASTLPAVVSPKVTGALKVKRPLEEDDNSTEFNLFLADKGYERFHSWANRNGMENLSSLKESFSMEQKLFDTYVLPHVLEKGNSPYLETSPKPWEFYKIRALVRKLSEDEIENYEKKSLQYKKRKL